MRRLVRPRVMLPTLCKDGAGGKKAKEHQGKRERDPLAEIVFTDHWNNPDVRGALYAMHGWVCAYCQCDLPRNDRGDVEHFRPKSSRQGALRGYWWLAYDFGNYLLSCRKCNSDRKSDAFPIATGAKPVDYARRDTLRAEERLLADPVVDEVEQWMRVAWEDPEQEGKVVASVRVAEGLPEDSVAYRRSTETIRFFKLNADFDLYRERRRMLERATKKHRQGDFDVCDAWRAGITRTVLRSATISRTSRRRCSPRQQMSSPGFSRRSRTG